MSTDDPDERPGGMPKPEDEFGPADSDELDADELDEPAGNWRDDADELDGWDDADELTDAQEDELFGDA